MYHKQQKSDLRLIESLGLFSPEARDSLRKLDASKDKGRVFGGVSHFVLRVRNLSDLISYLGNATLRTLREGDGDILPLFTNLGRGSLCNMVNTLCPLLRGICRPIHIANGQEVHQLIFVTSGVCAEFLAYKQRRNK